MFDFLNRFGLPVKYAILCFVGALFGVFLAKTFGYGSDTINYREPLIIGNTHNGLCKCKIL